MGGSWESDGIVQQNSDLWYANMKLVYSNGNEQTTTVAIVSYGYTAPDCSGSQIWDEQVQQCVAEPTSPQTCDEQQKLFDSSTGTCIDSCDSMVLDGVCLSQAPLGESDESENGDDCSTDSDDFKGVAFGKPYCDSNLDEPASCPPGELQYIVGSDSGGYACGVPVKPPSDTGDSDSESTETIDDGTTTTQITTNNQTGNTTTTETDNASGDSTTTNNYPGKDSETGGPCTSSSVSCIETPDTEKGLCKDGGSLCDDVRDIKDAIDQESDRTEKTGEFDTEQANTEVAQAETDLETGINSIRSEIGGYFDLALSGGDMVCGPGVDVLGTTIQICPSEMKEELAVIAQIVMLIAALISLMIIFR
jgi:hypothetical protein